MSFRAQLMLEEQRRLFDVWKSAAQDQIMPTRQQFSPCAFGALLPYVSLIEFSNSDLIPKVRVAGSALRGVFGASPHAELLRDDIDGSLNTIFEVKNSLRPLSGATQSGGIGNSGQLRYWIRLPLGHGDKVDAVIGLDISLSGIKAPNWAFGATNSAK